MKEPPSRQMLDLRNRIVGALLLQARTAAGQSREACAQAIGVSESDLSAYEFGRVPIPLSELEALAHHLQTPIEAFVDAEHNPVAQRAMRQQKPATMEHLPTELQQFVEEPLNVDYLRTAYRLSQIPGDRLRMIAEALLEITY
jgi:transcriptional regulator with XRE-family HTH domain